MLLTREQLLAKEDLRIEMVDFGDEHVFVKEMTGRERDNFERSLMIEIEDREDEGEVTYKRSLEDFRAKLAVVTLCDEEGTLLLNPSDYPILSQNMGASRLEKIVNVAQKINAITNEDKKELVKNSEASPDGDSTSDSVKN